MKSHWNINTSDASYADTISSVFDLDSDIAAILGCRTDGSLVGCYRYLSPKISHLHSPFLMKNMGSAVKRISRALETSEYIGVFADSDLDGLTSYTVLWKVLSKMGLENKPYLRFPVEDEDYGLSRDIIDEFAEQKISLLITLDSGIRDVDEISYARKKGMDVIVCDHHEPGPCLPEAIIVNPKQKDCSYPFKQLAGVGVVFKLSQALMFYSLKRYDRNFVVIAPGANSITASKIKNRIIERTVSFDCIESCADDADLFEENSTVILFECPEYGEIFGSYECYDLLELAGSAANLKNNDESSRMESLCGFYSINPDVFEQRIGLAHEIFFEYENSLSPKMGEFMESIIDLVALGTIADIMPLRDENRILVYHGIRSMDRTEHPGLRLLVRQNGNETTSKIVAWDIAPLLNTPGRFGKSGLTADFFLESDLDFLKKILIEINTLNNFRKKAVSDLYEYYREFLADNTDEVQELAFVCDPKIPEGICGLLANRLSDLLNKPVITVALSEGKEIVKGSGRVKGDYNFFSCVEPYSDMFEKIGGHAQAFGFSVRTDRLDDVKSVIASHIRENIENHDKGERLHIDMEIPLSQISRSFIDEISIFEPFGRENEELVFLSRDVEIEQFKKFGSGKNHGKYTSTQNKAVEIIGWNIADCMEEKLSRESVDIVYTLEKSVFNGITILRLVLIDLD